MKRQDKADRIGAILAELYPHPQAPLAEPDPYHLLIKVLLSAQCTDARVNQIAPSLFARAATPAAIAELSVDEIEAIIRPCGLGPTKAANISALSQALVAERGGEVPGDLEALETLPGVGHKTASVVVAQGFGRPAFPVDTHIFRLAGRWGLSRARNVVEVERDLKTLYPRERWHDIHLQIIFFGREHCRARYHDFELCPICSWATPEARRRRERARWKRKPARGAAS